MRAPRLSAAALCLAALASTRVSAKDCAPCAAGECTLDADAAKAARQDLALKLLNAGYPVRLVAPLVGKLPACEKCLTSAPSSLRLQLVEDDGTLETKQWTADLERNARQALRKGRLRAFYVALSPIACECCVAEGTLWRRQEAAKNRADWDPFLRMNRDAVLAFETPASLGPEPRDLRKATAAARTKAR